uniref:Ig-like domain-containing protein n=1 Tax=Pygocentrus nattereri TaxID=42514 RepID=A0AAR2KFF9_PYGNA
MQVCFYLLFVLHVAEGCGLVNSGTTIYINIHTGGSALLPCSCADLHTTPDKFIWRKYSTNRNAWKELSRERGQYRDRVQLFNGHSPGNLSLLISHLTEEDGGLYRCHVTESGYTDIRLTFEGGVQSNSETTSSITAHTGGSVLLPCYSTDLHTTPETFTWRKYRITWEEISSESGQYRNRVQLGNGHSPGNLSLLISHLTEEDGGLYRCDIRGSEYKDIRLTVKVLPNPLLLNVHAATPAQSLPFVPFALVTVIILHVIVAVVYHTKRNKVLETARIYYNSADEAVSL